MKPQTRPLRAYRVSQLAHIAGVSVRALHHYDELGLLKPSGRTEAGYRLYTGDDLLRLQQILIQRELGFPLEEIRRWLDDPTFDRRTALRQQREELARRAELAHTMLRSIDRALAMLDKREEDVEKDEKDVDLPSLFDGFDPAKYEVEVEERWGETEAFRISRARTRRYRKGDWRELKAEQSTLYAAMVAMQRAGEAPDGEAAMDVAERHRLFIDRWFYPCSHAVHAGLASLYDGDRRFAVNIDQHGAGLTPFLSAAIRANARRTVQSPAASHQER